MSVAQRKALSTLMQTTRNCAAQLKRRVPTLPLIVCRDVLMSCLLGQLSEIHAVSFLLEEGEV
jgi:hypothetical protein